MNLLKAVQQAELATIKRLLSSQELPSFVFDVDSEGRNIFQVAIANKNPVVLAKLLESLQKKTDKSWQALLLEKEPELPLIMAAQLKDPQLFDLLIKQVVAYSLDDLESAKKQRRLIFQSERRWGKWGALLKSACPSKSLAEALSIPSAIAGLGCIVGAGLLSIAAIPAAIIAFVSLGIIGFSNYKKIIGEQNLLDKTLDTTILLAEINNFEKKLSLASSDHELALLYPDLQRLKHNLSSIADVDFKERKKDSDFLTPFDRFYSALTTMGDILCTNAGLAGISALVIGAASASLALPLFIAAGLLMTGVAVFYIRNTSQHVKELAEQRRAQFDTEYRLYKSFKHFKHTVINRFKSEIELFELSDPLKAQDKQKKKAFLDESYTRLKESTTDEAYFCEVIRQGHRQWFKYLVAHGVPLPQQEDPQTGKTPLHTAVEKGHLLMVEEMLGVSIAAKNRENKRNWPNPYNAEKQEAQFKAFELLKLKRTNTIDHYTNLHKQAQDMLLIRDKKKHLPLYYAAGLKDPSLYYMLLKQGVAYSKEDLRQARDKRLEQVNNEKRWAKTHALMESICPGVSSSEIAFSISFRALLTGVTVLNPILATGSLLVFSFVTVCNYFKGKNERGISQAFEIASADLARLNSIKLELAFDTKETSELIALQTELKEIHDSHFKGTKAGSDNTRMLIFGITLGTFLCSYAGALGLMELGASALAVSVAGPIGLGFLISGAALGASIALYYYFVQAPHELRGFEDRRQKDYFKKESLEEVFKNKEIQELMNKSFPSPLSSLTQHQEHPGCINNEGTMPIVEAERKLEEKPITTHSPSLPTLSPKT